MANTYKFDLGGELGEVEFRRPHSLSAINDVCSEYIQFLREDRSAAKLGRVLGAALGVAWSENNSYPMPKYNAASGEVVAYGGACVEFLFKKQVQRSRLYDAGHTISNWLFSFLPKEEEVAKQAESFRNEGGTGSDDSTNRAGMA